MPGDLKNGEGKDHENGNVYFMDDRGRIYGDDVRFCSDQKNYDPNAEEQEYKHFYPSSGE